MCSNVFNCVKVLKKCRSKCYEDIDYPGIYELTGSKHSIPRARRINQNNFWHLSSLYGRFYAIMINLYHLLSVCNKSRSLVVTLHAPWAQPWEKCNTIIVNFHCEITPSPWRRNPVAVLSALPDNSTQKPLISHHAFITQMASSAKRSPKTRAVKMPNVLSLTATSVAVTGNNVGIITILWF